MDCITPRENTLLQSLPDRVVVHAKHLCDNLHIQFRDNAAFDLLKADFQSDVALRANAAAQVGGHLEQAFAFLEAALGEGQELVIFATELTAGTHTSWFIQNFGCEASYRHNKSLLFNDTQQALLSDIAQVRREDTGEA